jgi:hypothetical protein
MWFSRGAVVSLFFVASYAALAKTAEHEWKVGTVLDENRSRYFVGMLNNSSAQTNENGTLTGSANSTTYGGTTNTEIDGSYSGTRTTSTSGSSVPVYRVYDNLVIEGDDTIYVTSEHLTWRWSKGAHVAVNGTIRYYVDGRKLHVLDDDSKEHTIQIIKEIKKTSATAPPSPPSPVNNQQLPSPSAVAVVVSQYPLVIESTPTGADIEVDGDFVGNTPSTIALTLGSHSVTIKKKGFADWTRKINLTGGQVHVSAELEPAPPQ